MSEISLQSRLQTLGASFCADLAGDWLRDGQCGAVTVSAVHYIRPIHGASEASLIKCSDGHVYIVKTTNSSQPNRLANELLGSILARSVGIPVANPAFIVLSPTLLCRSPKIVRPSFKSLKPEPEVVFGSRFVGDIGGPRITVEYVSSRRIEAIENRSAFLGMYFLDVWANHQARRKVMFTTSRYPYDLQPYFINHDAMFGGTAWNMHTARYNACHPEKAFYSGLWSNEAAAYWIQVFRANLPRALETAISQVPPSWFQDDIRTLHQELLFRLDELPRLAERFFGPDSIRTRSFVSSRATNAHIGRSRP